MEGAVTVTALDCTLRGGSRGLNAGAAAGPTGHSVHAATFNGAVPPAMPTAVVAAILSGGKHHERRCGGGRRPRRPAGTPRRTVGAPRTAAGADGAAHRRCDPRRWRLRGASPQPPRPAP